MLIATEMLRNEHEKMSPMLKSMEEAANSLEQGTAVEPEQLRWITNFFVTFVGADHREHEEALLFPALEQKGLRRGGGLLGNLRMDHEEVESMLRHMVRHSAAYSQGLAESGKNWAMVARELVPMLRGHIRKENEVLYVLADNMLSEKDQTELAELIESAHQHVCTEPQPPCVWIG